MKPRICRQVEIGEDDGRMNRYTDLFLGFFLSLSVFSLFFWVNGVWVGVMRQWK